jgi:hypothetical protein
VGEKRNFDCPVTEQPCQRPDCLRHKCMEQTKESELRSREAAERGERAHWDKELRDLIAPAAPAPENSN